MLWLAALTLLLPPATWAQSKSIAWLDLPIGISYNLIPTADGKLVARIPAFLTADAGAAGMMPHLRIYDVVYNEGRSDELARQFSATFTPAGDTVASALVVSATSAAKLPPGTYSLTLQVSGDQDAKDIKPQLLTLSLTRRPAQLTGPSSIVLSKTSGVHLIGDEDTTATVTLRESSNKAAVTGLKFFDVREAMASGVQPSGKIKVTFSPRTVAPGEATEATVRTEGEFPLGTSKGKLDIVSSDLANAVAIGYEVKTRRGLWTIAVFAGLGALCGWWVRIRTAQASALAAARLSASRVLQLAREEEESSGDETYRGALTGLHGTMLTALESADPATIASAVKTFEEGVATARTKLQGELGSCATQADALDPIVGPAWELPSKAAQLLEQIRTEKANVASLLANRNAKAASTTLRRVTTEWLPALVNQVMDDGAALANYLVELRTMGPPLPDSVRAQILSEGDSARAQFPGEAATVPVVTLDEVISALQAIHRQYGRAQSLAAQLPSVVDDFVTREWARLRVNSAASKAALLGINAVSTSHAKEIAADLRDPAKGLTDLDARADKMKQIWIDSFTAVGVTGDTTTLHQALMDGKWSEAVDLAAKNVGVAGTRMGGVASPAPSLSADAANRLNIGSDRALSTVSARSTTIDLPPLEGSAAERAPLYRFIKRAAAAQSVFFALLFVVGVYVFYADTWVGTDQEILALFLLGFSVDLTSERVLALLKNPKAS